MLNLALAQAPVPQSEPKVLRYTFRIAETGFDPAQINDTYSRIITSEIFEGLLAYDHLARPIKLKPLTAQALPEVSSDFRTFTFKIKPGIFFADDPAFKGQKRELTASDYAYSLKRFADPGHKSPAWGEIEQSGIIGLSALREQAQKQKKGFDYDREIEGLRVLDRYTLQIKLDAPRPRFAAVMAIGDLYGAVAREVVEYYGDKIMQHPVGTGPFKLAAWRRSSLITLERNPTYRERYYDAEPNPDDAEGQALLARFKGRRLPMVDRVEVAVIEEEQPRWLAFLGGQHDVIERVAQEFINIAYPKGHVAPNLARKGIAAQRIIVPDQTYEFWNMDNATVGGYTPEKVALRRALSLAVNVEREIQLVRRGQAIRAQAPITPHTSGYDASFKSEMSEYNPIKAKALLDLYGFVDRDGDGWRDMPDGSPLVIERATTPDSTQRALEEILTKDYTAIGIKMVLKTAKWPENLKAARAGKLMSWSLAALGDKADGIDSLARFHSGQVGEQNMARFINADFDRIYAELLGLPDGPQREALFQEAKRIAVAYMPYKMHVHRMHTDMYYPWVIGYRRPVFWGNWWEYVDIDNTLKRP